MDKQNAKITLQTCSGLKRIFTESDAVLIDSATCLSNESFAYQVVVKSTQNAVVPVKVESEIGAKAYIVKKHIGGTEERKQDDYYVNAPDNMYPEILEEVSEISLLENEIATLFIEISASDKSAGEYKITVSVGDEKCKFNLTVKAEKLVKSDLILTNWFHIDGICNYFNVKPFTKEFYKYFKYYVDAYVKMGNNTILLPIFTPPLDTEIGGERLTTQLVGVKKQGFKYQFDFTKVKEFIDICKNAGVEKFEIAHLFTQWGGKACPKIMVEKNGEIINDFGWKVKSTSCKYKGFLKSFLKELAVFLKAENIFDKSYMHLTDEPSAPHVKRYVKLGKFVKKHNGGIPTLDALSDYGFFKKKGVDIPVVAIDAHDLKLFDSVNFKMLYYCVGMGTNYLTNRYFTMPLQRTAILGMQLYERGVQGFLHWGFNFYNTQFSLKAINPYEVTDAGGKFLSGDSFVVYPKEDGVNYSIRYFALMRGFEDYRLLKTVEQKYSREKVLEVLHSHGLKGLNEYPRSVEKYDDIRTELYNLL